MKTKYTLFRRGEMFYMQDSATGKQTSLHTKDETEAKSLLEARNAAQRQPVLNLHLARAYLTASDPAFVERTWQVVMEQMQSRGKESSRERYESVFKSPSFDALRQKKLMETTADDFFAVFKKNQVSINEFLKRLHNFAVHLGWIAIPIVAPYLWPKYEPKDRRGITQAEHESVLQKEKNAEWKLYLELLWETGAAQSDAVNFKAEDIDWQSRTISYFRMKTGSLAQFTISKKLETVLSHLPTTGALFPKLSTFTANDRASRFRRRCHKAGVTGVTLHCYRYAWAERAKVVGMPERFAQAALGHNSKRFTAPTKLRDRIVRIVEELQALDLQPEGLELGGVAARRKLPKLERELDDAIFDLYELNAAERDLVTEMCSVGLDFFYRNHKSDALQIVSRPNDNLGLFEEVKDAKDGLAAYLRIFLEAWNKELEPDCELAWHVVSPSSNAPLLMVQFTTKYKKDALVKSADGDAGQWNNILARLGKDARIRANSSRIFIDTFFRYVSDNEILFIKRNEKRFWTHTAAREDAESALANLMNLEDVAKWGKQ